MALSTYQIAFSNRPVYDAGQLYDQAIDEGLETSHWANKANRVTLVRGKMPSYGYFLLKQSDADALNTEGSHTIQIRENLGGNLVNDRAVVLFNFYVVSIKSIYASYNGNTVNPDGIAMVEAADVRHVLGMSTILRSYNVRCPAPPGASGAALCDLESLNGSILWTWQTLLESLWGFLPSLAGTCPLLPYTPSGTPENFNYWGWSAWDAVNDYLNRLNCSIILNYTSSTVTLSIVSRADSQPSLTTQINALVDRRLGNYVPVHPACSNIPANIRVLFNRIQQHYGTELETHRTQNIRQKPYEYIDVATGITGAVTGTYYTVVSDIPAVIDFDTTTVVNASDCTAKANEIASKLKLRLVNSRWQRMSFSGLATSIYPGAELESVTYEDLGVAPGLITQIHNRPEFVFGSPGNDESLYNFEGHSFSFRKPFGVQGDGVSPGASFELITSKNFPTKLQLLTIDYNSSTYKVGEPVTANAKGFFDGKVIRINPADDFTTNNPYYNSEDCWIAIINPIGGSIDGANAVMPAGERLMGRINGSVDGDGAGDIRPLYVVAKSVGRDEVVVIPTSSTHDTGNCLWAGQIGKIPTDGADPGIPSAFCSPFFDIGAAIWILILNTDLGSYATAKTRLVIGEEYLGHYIGLHPDDHKPIYAIRVDQNDIYHATATAAIVAGATGSIDLPVNGSTTVTGRVWGESNVSIGNKVAVFQDKTDLNWYILKGGGAGTIVDIVKVYGATKDANCLWAGKVVTPDPANPTGWCTDPLVNSSDCYLVVIDNETGSWGSGEDLTVGEYYIGRYIADFDMGGGSLRRVYAIKKSVGAGVARVRISDADHDSGNCMWPGHLITADLAVGHSYLASQCTDNFTNTTVVWIVVLNSNFGSQTTVKIKLKIDEVYHAMYLGTWSDGKPVYTIRSEDNHIYAITLAAGITAGVSGSVTLPTENGTEVVTAYNWSAVDLVAGDKVTVYKDHVNNKWYLIKSGSSSSGGGTILAKGLLTANVAPTDSTVTMGSMSRYDGVAIGATLTAQNVFGLLGKTGMLGAVVFHDASGLWDLIKLANIPSYPIECYVKAAFTKDTATFQAVVTKDYMGYLTVGTQLTVQNFEDHSVSPKPYQFEGEAGADCLINYDPLTNKFRVDWVECPVNPIVVSPGVTGETLASLYDQGGMDSEQLNQYFN